MCLLMFLDKAMASSVTNILVCVNTHLGAIHWHFTAKLRNSGHTAQPVQATSTVRRSVY